jgi:hypothetical protein
MRKMRKFGAKFFDRRFFLEKPGSKNRDFGPKFLKFVCVDEKIFGPKTFDFKIFSNQKFFKKK